MEKGPVERVSIDDPRAIFLFRFYVEVDKNGKDLAGYQNKECGAYRLTFDNNGEAWRFTSNYQVITVVAMTQHKKLGWPFFSIRPAELKTVLLKFKDMKDGNDGAGGDGRGGGGRGPGGGRGCGAALTARRRRRAGSRGACSRTPRVLWMPRRLPRQIMHARPRSTL